MTHQDQQLPAHRPPHNQQQRRERAIERRLRDACFRDVKRLEDFDWKFNAAAIDRTQIEQLATGEFVRRGDNLVFVGQSGVGKSHLIQALGRQCCVLGTLAPTVELYSPVYLDATSVTDSKSWIAYIEGPGLRVPADVAHPGGRV